MNQGWHYDGETPSSRTVSTTNDTGEARRGKAARGGVAWICLLLGIWFATFDSTSGAISLDDESPPPLVWRSADKPAKATKAEPDSLKQKPKKKSTERKPYVWFTPGHKTGEAASQKADNAAKPKPVAQKPKQVSRRQAPTKLNQRKASRQLTTDKSSRGRIPQVRPRTTVEPSSTTQHGRRQRLPEIKPQPASAKLDSNIKLGHWQTTTRNPPRQLPRSILRENPFRKLLQPKRSARTADSSRKGSPSQQSQIRQVSGTRPAIPAQLNARPVRYIAPPPRDPDMQLQVELAPPPPKSEAATAQTVAPANQPAPNRTMAKRSVPYISGPPRSQAPATQETTGLTVPQPPTMPIEPIPDPQPSSKNSLMKGLRLPHLPELPSGLRTPRPDADTLEKYNKFVVEENDPDNTLTLVVGRPKVLRFREAPLRTYMPEAGSKIIAMRYVEPKSGTHVAIEPLQTGSTVMSMWFRDDEAPGGQRYLSWLVNVVEDPERGRRLETIYASLEKEINRNFPDSVVRLSLVGDKLLVRGQAKDIEDATQILRIIGANAPGGSENVALRNVDMNLISQLNPDGDNAFDDGALQSLMLKTAEKDAVEAGSTVINMLRVAGEQQVMLKVVVAEVNRNALRAIGAKVTAGPTDFLSAFARSGSGRSISSNILAAEGGTFGINHGDFQLTLNALRRLGYAKTLAEPNVASLNGQAAIFRAGDTFPVPAANIGSNGAVGQTVTQQFVGVQIRFLPIVTDKDRVRLQLAGTVSALDNSLGANVGGSNVPGTSTRNFFTTVEMREGQTLALAGLISTSTQAESSRTPFAGDMPVIGRLFNTDSVVAQEQELLILVTPQLVHPLDPDEELPLPGSNVFEPDDLEFYFHGRLEGNGRKVFRSAIRTSWERIRAHRRAERRLIIGPTGYSDRQ